MLRLAAAGARSRKSMKVARPSLKRISMNPLPPKLPAVGCVTARARPTAMAASTALPPRRSVSMPTCDACSSTDTTMPWRARTGCGLAAETGSAGRIADETTSNPPRTDTTSERRLVFIAIQFNIEGLSRRILYAQYTNPAGYPPLEHSSRILAQAGWEVLFLGTDSFGGASRRFPPHPNIQEERRKYCLPGWRQKVDYLLFSFWVLRRILSWRPRWVYFSSPLDALLAWLVCWMPGVDVIYHEHDSPPDHWQGATSVVM